MRAWITSGGVIKQVVVVPPLALPQPPAPSDGESEAGASGTELPSPCQIVPKVHQADDVEHTLDKGLWAGTGATQCGWKIFVGVSVPYLFHISRITDSLCSGPVEGSRPNMSALSDTLTQVLWAP